MGRFKPATSQQLVNALGPIEDENPVTQKALSSIHKFWKNIQVEDGSDWQECYPRDGWAIFPKFGGKIFKKGSFDTLYIQPIVWEKNSVITP